MSVPSVLPYDIGFEPSPSVPAPTLLKDELGTFLLFFACTQDIDPATGYLTDLGVAILEFDYCLYAQFGGVVNSERLPEHPFWSFGMSELTTNVHEVVDSPWVAELIARMIAGRNRRSREFSAPIGSVEFPHFRHFLIVFDNSSFECVARELRFVKFANSFNDAYVYVLDRFSKH